MIGDTDIRRALHDVAEFLRDRAEDTGYGLFHPENPHDFTPDPEGSTEEERERHRRACEAWDRGETIEAPPTWTTHPSKEAASAYVEQCMKNGAASATLGPTREDGSVVVHCHVGGWGLGTYTVRDDEMLAMADKLSRLAGDLPEEAT